MDSAKSDAFEVSCWASVNWRCAKFQSHYVVEVALGKGHA